MVLEVIQVQSNRIKKDLLELAAFGDVPGKGIMRTALSEADLSARRWFQGRMVEAGLQVREDDAANMIGRFDPALGMADHPCIAIGSHIDTVPQGGKFDGALGLCAGLEAFRAIRESGVPVPCPIELLVFTDEEGSHFAGTFGSRAMLGLLFEGEIHQSKGGQSLTLSESLRRIGKDASRITRTARSPSEFRAFLELHIEQGPVLERMGFPIGIVEGIVGIDRSLIHVKGKSGHAGTVPMTLRDDALVKAAHLITAIQEILLRNGPEIVGTIGRLDVLPGAFNIIPDDVRMSLDLRSMSESTMASVREQIRTVVDSVDNASIELLLMKNGVSLDPTIAHAIECSCRQRGIPSHRMKSGAGHDAMTFQTLGIPTGMIFIPCEGGRSHSPDEAIRWDHAAIGAQILTDMILRIASEGR